MGVINHKIAIVITLCDDTNIDLFKAVVKSINEEWRKEWRTHFKDFGELVSDSGVMCNGFEQFTFNADGSKEDWAESERADVLREKFFRAAHLLLPMDRCILLELPEEGPMKVREH